MKTSWNRGHYRDRVGQVFGRLIVIAYAGKNKCNRTQWLCRCACGVELQVGGNNLVTGNTQSCGCLWDDTPCNRKRPFENAYHALIWHADHRGIKVVLTYEEFLGLTSITTCHYCGDAITWHPYGSQVSQLDRKDNSLGYSRENCVVACAICNRMKHTMEYSDFVAVCRKIARQHRGAANEK